MLKRVMDIDNPGKTARKILAAARATFADRGYDGTHMEEIARRAGVNKATIYYQIGDKDTLYANVIHQVLGNAGRDLAGRVEKVRGPEARLRTYILFIADMVDRNPEIPPVLLREIASGGRHLPRLVAEDVASIIAVLIGILEEGRQEGLFGDVVPFLVHTMIMGSILLYKKGAPIKERQLWVADDLKALDRGLSRSLGEEVADMVVRAVKQPGEKNR